MPDLSEQGAVLGVGLGPEGLALGVKGRTETVEALALNHQAESRP